MFRIFLVLLALAAIPQAHAASRCQGDELTPRPLLPQLLPQAEQAFGLSNAPSDWVQKTTVIRCMDGKIWACNAGANLPCGKANTATRLPAGDDWCRQNPNADFIPAYITGHDTAWRWRCLKGAPATIGPPASIDAEGYLSAYWKPLN
jgi:hypothetical protein